MPDERLDRLAEIFKPKKIVQADVTYVDLPAPPASSEGRVGTEELPAEHLAPAARFRCPAARRPRVRGPVRAPSARQRRSVRGTSSSSTSSSSWPTSRSRTGAWSASRRRGRHGTPAEREANEREEVILRRLKTALEAGRPIRDVELGPDEEKADPRLPVPDPEARARPAQPRAKADLPRAAERVADIAGRYQHRALDGRLAVGARSRWSSASSMPADLAAFMEELGIHESGLDRVIALSYRLLGLISFLTAGPDEVRAWPIPDGSTAVDAAAAIHTDLAKGFIRAEMVAVRGPAGAAARWPRRASRQAALGGQDLPRPRRRRPGGPLQPLILAIPVRRARPAGEGAGVARRTGTT